MYVLYRNESGAKKNIKLFSDRGEMLEMPITWSGDIFLGAFSVYKPFRVQTAIS